MYIMDGFPGPLCGECTGRACAGKRPPWQPDARGRAARTVASIGWKSRQGHRLPDIVLTVIADFLEFYDAP